MDKNYTNKLEMIVYTVGYSVQGESIIIFMKRDDIVEYTIVIDGYRVNSCNKTIDILNENNVKNINILCWTHPDEDHSVGLEDYIPYLNNNSDIIVGDGFSGIKNEWENANNTMYSFIIDNLNKRSYNKSKIWVRKACTGMKLEEFKFVNMFTSSEYQFQVCAFAPSDMHILHDQLEDVNTKKNAFSVGLYIIIGDYAAIFCADIPDNVFNNLRPKDIPPYIDYIKIPHHGSRRSLNLLKLFENNVEVACTTVKTGSHLPKKETIDLYKKRSKKLYCTNNLNIEEQEVEWGVIETRFRIDGGGIINKEYGNARKVV